MEEKLTGQPGREEAADAREIGAIGTNQESEINQESEAKQESALTIEESFQELERILEKLEDSESSLEESFRGFEQGMKLVKSCSAQIDQVEKQIIVLSEGEEHVGF